MESTARPFYDHYWTEGFSPVGRTLLPAFATLLERYAGPTIVDVGCGDAAHVGAWTRATGRRYRGFDVSRAAVELSVGQGFDVTLIEDASRLPLEDQSVDTVLCMEVLEHLFLPLEAVHEMRRVLRPGGTLVVTVPNIAHWRTRADMLFLGRWHPGGDELSTEQPWRDPHIRFFTPASLRAMLGAAELDVHEVSAIPERVFGRMPVLRNLTHRTGAISTALCRRWPAMFATHVVAVCGRPPSPGD